MSKLTSGQTPREGYESRDTPKGGGKGTPHNSSARNTPASAGRGPQPAGSRPRPDTGDAMSNTQPHDTVDPIVVGPSGDSGTTKSVTTSKVPTGGRPLRGTNLKSNPFK